MGPDLRQIRYVVAIARERNFTRAAEQHHVPQQALSRQVRTVGNNIAAGRGVALVVASSAPQVRGGIALVKLGPPPAHIILDALWRRDNEPPTVRRFIDTARRVSTGHAWL